MTHAVRSGVLTSLPFSAIARIWAFPVRVEGAKPCPGSSPRHTVVSRPGRLLHLFGQRQVLLEARAQHRLRAFAERTGAGPRVWI